MDKQLDIRGDRVGDVLLAEGKVTRAQLDEARRVQIQDHRDLSDILLSLGYIGKEDLARALARKLRLKYCRMTEVRASTRRQPPCWIGVSCASTVSCR